MELKNCCMLEWFKLKFKSNDLNKVCVLMLAEVLVIYNWINQMAGTNKVMTKKSGSFSLATKATVMPFCFF